MSSLSHPDSDGQYPSAWEADVVLTDGHTVHVRPIAPSDGDRLRRFHSRQSPESIYLRYFSPRPELAERDVAHFTHVDHDSRVAFIALSGDELIGVARYERYKGTSVAEVAFFVDDAYNGRGLATLLLEFLAAAGRERGVRRFSASTLPSNHRMLSVFSAAGYELATKFDAGVIEVGFDIIPTEQSVAAMDRRERRAEAASVQRLMQPRSAAVVGAGREPGGLGAEVFRNIVANGFTGEVHPVNREARSVDGVPAVATVGDLPAGIDVVVVAAPASEVIASVERCGRLGVGAVIVLSAGFSESGPEGAELERELVSVTRRYGMRLLGPNCMGMLNTDPHISIDATLNPVMPRAGGVAVMTETGTLAAAIIDHAVRIELGISTFVAAGNRADITPSDLLSYWTTDDRTDAVLLSLADWSSVPRLVRAATATSLVKPVAALHTTGAVRGAGRPGTDVDRRAQAMFRQTGVISVTTLEQLFDLGRVIADQPIPMGRGVAVVGNSDGAVMLAASACAGSGLNLVPIEVVTAAGTVVTNPIDLSYSASGADFAAALEVVAADERIHSVLVIYTPPHLELDMEITEVILAASVAHPEVTFVSTMLGAADRGRLVSDDHAGAVPIFRFPEDAAHALGRLASYRSWRRAADGAGLQAPSGVDPERADAVVGAAIERAESAAPVHAEHVETGGPVHPEQADTPPAVCLDQDEQEQLLSSYLIEIAEREVVANLSDAVAAANRIGWPVVLKAAARDRSTRATSSGVALDISDPEHLELVWGRMESAIGTGMLPAVVQRFIASGTDVSVAVRRESTGAGTIEIGLGGPAAIIPARELGVLPLGLGDATALVAASPIGRVLTDPLDRVPLVELVHRIAALSDDLDHELTIMADPIVVSRGEAVVADVEIVVSGPVEEFSVRRLD